MLESAARVCLRGEAGRPVGVSCRCWSQWWTKQRHLQVLLPRPTARAALPYCCLVPPCRAAASCRLCERQRDSARGEVGCVACLGWLALSLAPAVSRLADRQTQKPVTSFSMFQPSASRAPLSHRAEAFRPVFVCFLWPCMMNRGCFCDRDLTGLIGWRLFRHLFCIPVCWTGAFLTSVNTFLRLFFQTASQSRNGGRFSRSFQPSAERN